MMVPIERQSIVLLEAFDLIFLLSALNTINSTQFTTVFAVSGIYSGLYPMASPCYGLESVSLSTRFSCSHCSQVIYLMYVIQ